MTKPLIKFVFALLLTSTAHAFAGSIFEKPFIMGASISAGYGGIFDGLAAREYAKEGRLYFGVQPGPGTRLAMQYSENPDITNIAEMVQDTPGARMAHRQFYRAAQDKYLAEKLVNASVWITVDGFYWPMIVGQCQEAEEGALDMIAAAVEMHKPLVIGNIPDEDERQVSAILKYAGWKKPNKNCLERFNQLLRENCLPENRCHIVDLYKTAQALNGQGFRFNGRRYFTRDFRFDGVHLSKLGIQWMMSDIVRQLLQKPAPMLTPMPMMAEEG